MNKEEIVNKLENVVNNEKGEIKSWFNANKQRNILLIICIVLVGIIFLLKSCNNSLKNELNGSKQNEKALSDSIRVEIRIAIPPKTIKVIPSPSAIPAK